jgi:hypothetical protein
MRPQFSCITTSIPTYTSFLECLNALTYISLKQTLASLTYSSPVSRPRQSKVYPLTLGGQVLPRRAKEILIDHRHSRVRYQDPSRKGCQSGEGPANQDSFYFSTKMFRHLWVTERWHRFLEPILIRSFWATRLPWCDWLVHIKTVLVRALLQYFCTGPRRFHFWVTECTRWNLLRTGAVGWPVKAYAICLSSSILWKGDECLRKIPFVLEFGYVLHLGIN